jgi:hypothetical protein
LGSGFCLGWELLVARAQGRATRTRYVSFILIEMLGDRSVDGERDLEVFREPKGGT